jgi:signal transduction histidine kinase
MPKNGCADELARECVRLRSLLRQTGTVLHDDIGSLLAVAGLRLQLTKMDYPEAGQGIADVSEVLDGVVGHVRKLSREVEPSPVRRTGLKNALLDLAETAQETSGMDVTLNYSVTATLSPDAAEAIYLAARAAVSDAATRKGVRRITIKANGSKKVTVRVSHDMRTPGTRASLEAAALLARHAGLRFDVTLGETETKHGTIVAIDYVL